MNSEVCSLSNTILNDDFLYDQGDIVGGTGM